MPSLISSWSMPEELGLGHLGPQLALQRLAGLLVFAVQIVKEIKVGILCDLGMSLQETAPVPDCCGSHIPHSRATKGLRHNLGQRGAHA